MMNSSQLRLGIMAPSEGERKNLNSELWHACAGPLVSLPAVGTRVVYFPQGHSEQVAASTQKEVNAHIPNYPNLPPQLVCQLHDVVLHADLETDEVYCQMTLQPVNLQERECFFVPDIGSQSRQPSNFFCKTLTASDTSTHGGFSIPRRAAEKVFPSLDYAQQPPAQELVTRDLHDTEWKFRHIYRGQPKRHLLTTGWSVFVSAKRLTAGDAVLFIRNEKGHLFLGIRRANRPPTALPSSVLSSDSMHIGVLAAAAHAASTNSRFTVFYNPRASPSDFVISYSKYEKAVYHTRVSVGMRFRMLFETEESSARRYMGTITGIGDLDPVRWPNSQWRSIKVGWDESTAGERQRRVSLWEIEPLTAFLVYPPSSNWRFKHPWPQPISGSLTTDGELETLKKSSLWMQFQGINGACHGSATQGLGGMNPLLGSMQHRYDAAPESDVYDALGAAALQEIYPSKQLHFQHPPPMQPPDQMLYRAQLHPHHHQSPFLYLPQQQQQQQQQAQAPYSSQQQIPAFQSAAQIPFSMQGDRRNIVFSHQPSPYGPASIERQVQQHHQHALQQSHQAVQPMLPMQEQPQQPVHHTGQQQHHTGQQQQVQLQQPQPALLPSPHPLQQQQASLSQSPNQQHQPSLPQAYYPLLQPQTHATQQEQIHQQHLLLFPNAANNSITQLPSPQPQIARSSIVGMSQLTSTEPPTTVPTSTTGFQSPLQSILATYGTDTGSLHSNAVPSAQPILRSSVMLSGSEPLQDPLSWHPAATHVSTSGFQAEVTTSAVYTAPQTDPLGLPKLSATGLPPSPFGFRECPPEQDNLNSDLHRQTLFGVDDGLPSLAIPSMSPGLRGSHNGMSEFQSMQGQSSASMDLACSPDAFDEGREDNGFSQQCQNLANAILPLRTYTKVYKKGSVGRSVDVTRFCNYEELREEVARLFGLEGPRSGWQLIFADKENDWLLLGDDPWEEFITNVRCIQILSPFDGPAHTQDEVGAHVGFVNQRQASSSSEDEAYSRIQEGEVLQSLRRVTSNY